VETFEVIETLILARASPQISLKLIGLGIEPDPVRICEPAQASPPLGSLTKRDTPENGWRRQDGRSRAYQR
jgi:hypothetical protein